MKIGVTQYLKKQVKKTFPGLFVMLDQDQIQQKNVSPNTFQLIVACLLRPSQCTLLYRQFRAARLPISESNNSNQYPSIEGLVVVARKDFGVLTKCINSIQSGSVNPISRIVVITPNSDVELCVETINNSKELSGLNVHVVDEDTLFDINFLKELKNKFTTRYGWVLQQLLSVKYVFNSDSAGVLVMDADTVLLSPRTWLLPKKQQLLLVSSEYNRPYYVFLNKIFGTPVRPKHTFITHHMFMQPQILRDALSRENIFSIESLGSAAIKWADLTTQSPVCLEFEVYGQLICKHFPQLVTYEKFSNKGLATDMFNIPNEINAGIKENEYMSLSFHEYFRTSQIQNH